jgi:hypothetical protein
LDASKAHSAAAEIPVKRGRGRPKGSKTKPKTLPPELLATNVVSLAAGAARVGPRAWVPSQGDREKVQAMSGVGIPQEKIAAVLRISVLTLNKHFVAELIDGSTIANAAVGRFLYDAATGRETYTKKNGTLAIRHIGVTSATVTAAIFWAKTRCGWKEARALETPEGADSAPEASNVRARLERRFDRLAAAAATSESAAGAN